MNQEEMQSEFVDVYSTLTEKLVSWMETTIEMLPNMVIALLVLIAFFIIGKYTRRVVKQMLHRVTINKTIINLLETVVGILIIGIGVFIALSILNLDGTVTSLLAGAGIVGLALGFAFQDIAANFISGIILSIRHPFGIGDIIETNDYFGTVQKMNLRNTIIKTPDGQVVYIPNKAVFENPLENYTKGAERRIDLSCGISYGDDLRMVRELAVEAIEELDNYNKDRDVEFYYDEFGDSSINFEVRFWIRFVKNPDYWSARSEAIMALKKKFDENDIMIPFPIRTLDFGIRGGEKLNTMLKDDNQNAADSTGRK